MAIVVPAMGSISSRFGVDFASAQFVISAYLFGLAAAQPITGFFCDRFGRRRVMLAGFSLFTVASIFCALAATLPMLVAARFVQAVGVSVGTVASRAILRDTRSGERMTEAMSYIAAAMGIAPIVAPILGGTFDSYAGYQSIFYVSALMGGVVLISMYRRLSETLAVRHAQRRARDWVRSYRVLLTSRQFVGYTLVFGFVQGTFFSFLAVGASYFETAYSIDSKTFGFIWGSMAVAYVIGAAVSARMTPRIGAQPVMRIAIWLTVMTGAALFLLSGVESPTPFHVLMPVGFLMMFAGVVTPGALAGAVRFHPATAGTASGLSSAIGLVIGGGFTIVSGYLYSGEFSPIATLMFAACCLTAAGWWLAGAGIAAD